MSLHASDLTPILGCVSSGMSSKLVSTCVKSLPFSRLTEVISLTEDSEAAAPKTTHPVLQPRSVRICRPLAVGMSTVGLDSAASDLSFKSTSGSTQKARTDTMAASNVSAGGGGGAGGGFLPQASTKSSAAAINISPDGKMTTRNFAVMRKTRTPACSYPPQGCGAPNAVRLLLLRCTPDTTQW